LLPVFLEAGGSDFLPLPLKVVYAAGNTESGEAMGCWGNRRPTTLLPMPEVGQALKAVLLPARAALDVLHGIQLSIRTSPCAFAGVRDHACRKVLI
jgi:hypothetical protein